MARASVRSDSFDLGQGDVSLRVQGLGKTLRAMADAGASAEDMRDLMYSLGSIVVNAANPPVGDTGRLATTLRAGRGKTKAVVRAGGARTPYAGVIHYGWPARNIQPQPFLSDALDQEHREVLQQLEAGIGNLIKDHDL